MVCADSLPLPEEESIPESLRYFDDVQRVHLFVLRDIITTFFFRYDKVPPRYKHTVFITTDDCFAFQIFCSSVLLWVFSPFFSFLSLTFDI